MDGEVDVVTELDAANTAARSRRQLQLQVRPVRGQGGVKGP